MRSLFLCLFFLASCERDSRAPSQAASIKIASSPASASVPVVDKPVVPAPVAASIAPPASKPVVRPPVSPEANLAKLPVAVEPDANEQRLYVRSAIASSILDDGTPRADTRYHPNYAFDDNPISAWNEGSDSNGVNEYLEARVPEAKDVTRLRFLIKNGFQKPAKLFTQNARVKVLKIELPDTEQSMVVKLPDSTKEQEVAFPVSVRELTRIKFTVLDVYDGSKFADLCISDIQIFVSAASIASPNSPDELSGWIESQREISRENKTFTALGIPLAFTDELLTGATDPFSDDDKKYIEAAKSLLSAKKVVPVAFTHNAYPDIFGVECEEFDSSGHLYDEEPEPKDDEYWVMSGEHSDVWVIGCLDENVSTVDLSSYQVTKTTTPERESWDVSYWSTPDGYQRKSEIRVFRIRETVDMRTGTPEYETTKALAYDSSGHLRAYVEDHFGKYTIKTFAWGKSGARSFLLGGFRSYPAEDGSLVTTRLVPLKMPLPKELTLPSDPKPESPGLKSRATENGQPTP